MWEIIDCTPNSARSMPIVDIVQMGEVQTEERHGIIEVVYRLESGSEPWFSAGYSFDQTELDEIP